MTIDGKKIASEILERLKSEVAGLGFKPVLCDIVIGNDPVSAVFVKIKQKAAESIGLEFRLIKLPENAIEDDIVHEMKTAQKDKLLCGMIVQLPLPGMLEQDKILSAIEIDNDVDVISPAGKEVFYSGQGEVEPPTAGAVMEILDSLPGELLGKRIVVVGHGQLVGKPVAFMLQQRNLAPEIVDIDTLNKEEITRKAQIIISGAGKAGMITADMVANGAMIIDAGTSEANGETKGDVDFESVSQKAAYITPVPGGVGPVTVAKLLQNTVNAAKKKAIR